MPGVGAQGGDLEKAVASGQNACGGGILINASRAVLYAAADANFAAAAHQVADQLRQQINACRTASD